MIIRTMVYGLVTCLSREATTWMGQTYQVAYFGTPAKIGK